MTKTPGPTGNIPQDQPTEHGALNGSRASFATQSQFPSNHYSYQRQNYDIENENRRALALLRGLLPLIKSVR
jgi:hypothetical protein